MEHLAQAVIKLELLLQAAKSAHCAEECAVLRSAQTVILDALLEQKARLSANPTIRMVNMDVLRPAHRLIAGASESVE